MRKFTAELNTISVCDMSLITNNHCGQFNFALLKALCQVSHSVGISFQTWQKMNSQTMQSEIRVSRFSLDFISSFIKGEVPVKSGTGAVSISSPAALSLEMCKISSKIQESFPKFESNRIIFESLNHKSN